MSVPVGPRLTRSVEDYLKTIYHLSLEGQPATTSAIAQALELAPPSVSGMIRRLSDQGLLAHVPYRGVELTPAGRRAALQMVRRHRIIEAYLVDRLGYTWDTVHEEAEKLEHAVSDALIERMANALGHPEFDPHGDPIPDASGRMADLLWTPVTELPIGEAAELRRVDTKDPELLRYFASVNLTPRTTVRVAAREPFDGPLTILAGGRRHLLGPELARLLLCSRHGSL
ncbi:MAG: metal-dependent transcriptional regulator [Gemmatimonadota bacterium]|jgi:DtxR family Mn-dependent transcriptional regulator|nr:metal-dependent transcriptional regulator [Gemmatimonadota bacterium]